MKKITEKLGIFTFFIALILGFITISGGFMYNNVPIQSSAFGLELFFIFLCLKYPYNVFKPSKKI